MDGLLKKKNVVIVYTGEKETEGRKTGRTALRVGVTKKLPMAQLAKKDIVPKKVKGIETDVFETDEIRALAVDRKSRVRPAKGGVSIGHPSVTAGTLGMVVKKKGVLHILSNNHVLADSNKAEVGDMTWQPGRLDGGTAFDTIGHLAAFVPIQFSGESTCPVAGMVVRVCNFFAGVLKRNTRLCPVSLAVNKVDCAISRPLLDEDISQEILDIGKPAGFAEAMVGEKVKKSGRTTALTEGTVMATDGMANVNYGDAIAVFEDQIVTTPMCQGGDSGSAVLNGNNEAVGLLFAGSQSLTIVNKIKNVIDALELDNE